MTLSTVIQVANRTWTMDIVTPLHVATPIVKRELPKYEIIFSI